MALNLRLTDEDAEALRAYAAEHNTSMQQAAVDGIRQMLRGEDRARFIRHILDEDRELLHRHAQWPISSHRRTSPSSASRCWPRKVQIC